MSIFGKILLSTFMLCSAVCVAEPAVVNKIWPSQKLPSKDTMKTAYVYLNWYIAQLRKDQLTQAQKDRLKELTKQVEANFDLNGEKKKVDTHQLWQQLGQLERELAVIASALDMPAPPSVFCSAEPMTSTQLSVRPPRRVPDLKPEEMELPKKDEDTATIIPQDKKEFDPDED